MTINQPTYSICICNYNMADTLERALRSVLDQVDDRFEVVVVDDGSSDGSLEVLRRLTIEYSQLRVVTLKRDRKRMLGLTRNRSVEEAKGEFVLLHIDADDVWEPYLAEFVQIFHRLESAVGKPIFLQGQQVNMARRDFMLARGPYRNIYRGEDRDLWQRLAAEDAFFLLLHRPFRKRLVRPKAIQARKSIWDMWSHMLYDLRHRYHPLRYVWDCLTGPFRRSETFSFRQRVVRCLLAVPAYFVSLTLEPLTSPLGEDSHRAFAEHRSRMSATYEEFMVRYGVNPDLGFLSVAALAVFRTRPKSAGPQRAMDEP